MVRAFSYLRFSSPEQAHGDSARRQSDLAAAYAARHGLELDETLIRANTARLMADAEFLSADGRHASAFALAVLALEEVGKVVLALWGAGGARKVRGPAGAHINKQLAVATLLTADSAMGFVNEHLPAVLDVRKAVTEEEVSQLARHLFESREDQLARFAAIGAVDKAKQIGLYVDSASPPPGLSASDFTGKDVASILADADRALTLTKEPRTVAVALAMWRNRAAANAA